MHRWVFPILMIFFVCFPGKVQAQTSEEETVREATQVINQIMAIPAKGIPAGLLKDAYGVAIIPGMVKGGFIISLRHGAGVVLRRDNKGGWQLPFFVTMTGGSIGFQAGLQSTDLILVFKSQRSVDGLMRGKFTIGADASVAAGPVGREAAAATDAQLKAEILSYSRTRGIFAGVSIAGAAIQMDHRANNAYYAAIPGQPNRQIPASAVKLLDTVVALTETPRAPVVVPVPIQNGPPVPVVGQPDSRDALRQQLADSSKKLLGLVDVPWQKFLALPAEVYTGPMPTAEQLTPTLNRYNTIAADQRYQALTSRREFQETHSLLNRLVGLETTPRPPTLQIPPPPR